MEKLKILVVDELDNSLHFLLRRKSLDTQNNKVSKILHGLQSLSRSTFHD